MELLEKLKVMSGNEYEDELLNVYLDMAKSKILNIAFPYDKSITDLPAHYEHIQLEAALYLLNKRGAEGQLVHNENGVYRMYESSDLPKSLISQITPKVEVVKL